MPPAPEIQYFLSDHNESIHTASPIWKALFPISRSHTQAIIDPDRKRDLCYGDYFEAVRTFLERNRFQVLTQAASEYLNKKSIPADMKSIHIRLEKHGAFYHPCRIEVILGTIRLNFVLNVAVTETGQRHLLREYNLIHHLNRKYKCRYLPKLHGSGEIETINGSKLLMFLGEWFDGFHEFHITSGYSDENRIVVWDPYKRNFELPVELTSLIYEKTSEILTIYYDPITFEQIHPWSHAAGDFIIRVGYNDLDMRIISARNYMSIMNPEEPDARSILEALLVFLLNLSVQNRLDRLDGVGDIVWAGDQAVSGTIRGFLSGLSRIETPDFFSEPLIRFFKPYLAARSENDLMEICRALLDRYPPNAPEAATIRKNLNQHVACFHRSVQQSII